MEYLLLTEATLPRLLLRAALRRPTCVFASISLARGEASGHLDAIAGWLLRCGRVTMPRPNDPIPAFDEGDFIRTTDIFAETEPWLESYFDFAAADRKFRDYASAYRHVICSQSFRCFRAIHLLKDALAADSPKFPRVVGLGEFERAYVRRTFPDLLAAVSCRRLNPDGVVNFLLAAFSFLYGVFWIAWRTRTGVHREPRTLLGVDAIGGPLEDNLLHEVPDSPGQARMFFRNRSQFDLTRARYARWSVAAPDAARFSTSSAIDALLTLARDTWLIFRNGRQLPSGFFRALIALPWRRIAFRGLFARYPVDYFWARDEYNAHHIVRSQELRRSGAVSMGMLHGLPSICRVQHQLRHIDYDVFYVHGRDVYERSYASRWPKQMTVRIIGSSGLTRDELSRLHAPRPGNIACVIGDSMNRFKALEIIKAVAEAFPDRTVFVNGKNKFFRGEYGAAVDRLFNEGPSNLVRHEGRSYEMFFQCSYALTGGSTLTAEAIQFGLAAFMLDLDPRWKALFYREYPGICIQSADEVIQNIRAIENGSYIYPRHTHCDIISMTGKVVWDIIRGDMGLPPKSPAFMPHLAFCPEHSTVARAVSRHNPAAQAIRA